MRVLQVLEATLGGTGRYIEDVAHAVEGAGYTNAIAYSLKRADDRFKRLLPQLEARGWHLYETYMRRRVSADDARSAIALGRIYDDFKPDVVHAHSSKAGAVARLAKLTAKQKPAIVYSPHAIAVDLSRVYEVAERFLAPLADHFVAVGPSEKASLQEVNLVPADRISIVAPFIDGTHFMPMDQAQARRDAGYDDGILVGAAGRLVAQKDPFGFIRFLYELRKLVPGVRGVWIGDGILRDEFIEALHEFDLYEAVRITGWVSDIRPHLAAVDLIISTSTYESFGYVTAEAVAMGKAVVASEITGTIDILTTDPERQLYPAGDYKRAAQLARDLLQDRELLVAVAARSRESVVERFSADRTRDELVCAYEVAMRHRAPSTERRARFSAIGSRTL